MTPDEIAELTIPQLAILANDGTLPKPHRRTFASAAQAVQWLKEGAAKNG